MLIKPNTILRVPIFPEPVQVITTVPMGDSIKLIGKGLKTNQVYEPVLNREQISTLVLTPEKAPFDGDDLKFRLGIEAMRLSLAYEYPEDAKTFTEVRFIEVKGRAAVGEIAFTTNEFKTAERLKKDFWLYVVYNCGATPELHPVQDPARLGWEPLAKVEHWHVGADKIISSKPD